MFDDPVLAMPDMRRLVVAQLCDLIAVTLGATRDAAAVAEVVAYAQHDCAPSRTTSKRILAAEDLSPDFVARRQKISDSYIRKLFESEGTSFSQVRPFPSARSRASHVNRSPVGRPHYCVDCFRGGFGDLSYFNRTFKRFYGVTPSEVRGG